MIVAGAINLALPLLIGFVMGLAVAAGEPIQEDEFFFAVLTFLPGALIGMVMLAGGVQMRKFRSYGLAVAAGIAAFVPISPLWLINLALGIWALAVLFSADVKGAFAAKSRSPAPNESLPPQPIGKQPWPADETDIELARRQIAAPAIGMICVSILTVLPILLAIGGIAIGILMEVIDG